MIREIVMQNIKGVSGVQQLTGKDIIIGPNGVGKTTRLQSLGISLLGYVPGQGKLESETFKLSSNQNGTMTVGLKTLDSFHFTRSYTRKESTDKDGFVKVSVAQDLTVSPSKGEKNPTAKKARVLAEVGDFPVMLDFQEFLKLSDAKRREFIYSLSPIKSSIWDREMVEAYIEDKLLTTGLEANNPDQYGVYEELIKQVMKEWTENLGLQEGLQAMIDWAKAKQTHWNSEKKDAQGAVRKLSDLKNQLDETDRNISENKKVLGELQQQLIEVEKEISASNEKKKAVEKQLNRINELEQQLAGFKENPIQDISGEIDGQITGLEGQIKPIDVTAAVKELEDGLTVNENRNTELTKAREDLYKDIADTEANIKALQKLKETIEKQGGLCLLSNMLPAKKIGCDKDFSKVLEHIETETDKGTIKRDELKASYDEMGKEINDVLKPQAKELKTKIKAIQDGASTQVSENDKLRKQIAQLEKQKADNANAGTRRDDQIKLSSEELLRVQSEKVDAVAPTDVLEVRASGLRDKIKALNDKIDEQTKAKTTLSNLKTSMIDSKKSSYNADGSKYLVEALGAKGIQGELVKSTLDPIREEVQKNLNLMGIDQEFFFDTESDTGKEIFQFGWKNGFGDKLNFDALSTGQQLLLLIALTVTIIDRANPKIKVLAIDNIENLDSGNFSKVIDGLNQLKDKLDNIILAGVIHATEIPGWKIWDLGKKEEAKADEVA